MQAANATPSLWLRRLPIVLVLVLAAFGALVEYRSCFIERRMGDLTVFVRTAWAVRSGEDIYDVADEKGFHYQYAPLLAILMTPLADPPAGVDRTWVLPYPAITAVWYILNVFFLAVAVHGLASALEELARRLDGRTTVAGRSLVAAAAGAGAGLPAADRAHADARTGEPAAAAAALRHGDGDAARAAAAIGLVAGRRRSASS